MKGKKTTAWLLLVVALLGLPGCGGDEGAQIDAKTEKALTSDSPVEAMNAIRDGIANNKPEVLWAAMPESYRADVTGLVHDFAAKVDPEMFGQATGLMKRAATLLDGKKQFIVNFPMLKMMAGQAGATDANAIEQGVNGLIGMLKTVAESDLMDLDELKELDVGRFVQTTGGSLMSQMDAIMSLSPQNPLGKMGQTIFTEVSRDGDSARLKVQVPDKPESHDDLTRIEGRWIPTDMAEEWKKAMDEARQGLAEMDASKMTPEKRQEFDQGLAMVSGMLDELEKVQSQSDFNRMIGKAMGPLMGGMMGGGRGGLGGGRR